MKLSQQVKKYLVNGKGTPEQQKAAALQLALLAPVDYTEALLTGEAGATIGAELLTAADLVKAFESEVQLMKAVQFELQQHNYFNKIVAIDHILEQKRILRNCIKQLRAEEADSAANT